MLRSCLIERRPRRPLPLLAFVVLAVAGLPAVAQASTLRYDAATRELTYVAAAGETNRLAIDAADTNDHGFESGMWVSDPGAVIEHGPECHDVPATDAGPAALVCPTELSPLRWIVDLGDGDDVGGLSFQDSVDMDVRGGPGNDRLGGGIPTGGGAHRLDGGEGDDDLGMTGGLVQYIGGPGDDVIVNSQYSGAMQVDAGTGDDTVTQDGGVNRPPARLRDVIKLGAGDDTLSYGRESQSWRYVTNSYGSFATPDVTLDGGSGIDTLKADTSGTGFLMFDLSSCACLVENVDLSKRSLDAPPQYPPPAVDPSDPFPPAPPRPNLLIGGPGKNVLRGDAGPDIIIPKGGGDYVFGGGYDDTIVTAGDALRDVVSCGPGTHDRVSAEWVDTIWTDCEHTTRAKLVPTVSPPA